MFSDDAPRDASAPGRVPDGRPQVSEYPPDRLAADVAADCRKQASKLLDAIEAGLPDSQFAPDTAMALDRLAKLMENSHRNDLAKYLEHSKRLSGVTTTMARNSFRSLIRLCLELVDQNPKETPGLAELRAEYLDHQRAESGRREQALKNGDFELLRKVGHDLKGTATSYGFAELTEIGRALETAAKENNAVAVDVLLERILSYLAIVWPSPEDRQDAERF